MMAPSLSNDTYNLSYVENTGDFNETFWYDDQVVNVPYVTALIIEFIIGVPTNISLILLVAKVRELRTAPNLLLANLAVGDLIFLLMCVPNSILLALNKYGTPLGVCKFQLAVYYSSFAVSSLSLTVISFERYMAIVRPFALIRGVREARTTVVICALIWIISVLLFGVYPWHVAERRSYNSNACSVNYNTKGFQAYYFSQLTLLYLGPMVFMTIFYALCTRELLRKRRILGQGSNNHGDRSRMRVAFNLMLITFLFSICWLPNYVFYTIFMFFTDFAFRHQEIIFTYLSLVKNISYYLASCINPLVLYAMSSSFRHHLIAAITCSKNASGRRRNGYLTTRDNARSVTLKSTVRIQETVTSNSVM